MLRRRLLALPAALLAAPALAQDGPFPSRPIRVIMPLAAGSAVDVMVRIVADRMGETLHVPMPGGVISAKVVAPMFYDAEGSRLNG